jgi:isopenicillin-N epimerase
VSPFARHFVLDPAIDFLNHGSFGACPRVVLEEQDRLRTELERQPVHFMARALEPLLDAVRERVARLVGARTEDLVFVMNTTEGVNAVLASLPLDRGDEILITNHGYNACNNAVTYWAERRGARRVVADVPVPLAGPDEVVAAVMRAVTPSTRLALVDQVTSPTGIVFPARELVAALRERGVLSLIDGAHAPGMLPLDLAALDADYYVGNLHKWCCTPKGTAILVARADRHATLHPLVISHGANTRRTDRPKLWLEFDWVGTVDPTGVLAVPRALDFLESLLPGGFPALMEANRALARAARACLLEAVGGVPLCPEEMLGALAAVSLPDAAQPDAFANSPFSEPLYSELRAARFEAFALPWPAPPKRVLRVTAQIYNELSQYERLAALLRDMLGR